MLRSERSREVGKSIKDNRKRESNSIDQRKNGMLSIIQKIKSIKLKLGNVQDWVVQCDSDIGKWLRAHTNGERLCGR